MAVVYKTGNTLKIEITFQDFAGDLFDPTLARARVYDDRFQLIVDDPLTAANRIELGKYFYYFTIPESSYERRYVAEFSAEFEGVLSLERVEIKTTFV